MHRACLSVLLVLCTSACRSTAPAPAPAEAATAATVVLSSPPADWAALAGRRVRIDAPLTISGNHRLGRERELAASFGGRLFSPTEQAPPGAPAQRLAGDNRRRQLAIRLGADVGRPARALRSGGVLDAVVGLVAMQDGKAVLLAETMVLRSAARPGPPTVAGDVRVAGLNLENLFNGDGDGGGFPTARGAATVEDYRRQQARLVATLVALDPDIAALMELENDGAGPTSSLAQLVAALRAARPGADWRFVDSGGHGPGGDDIRVGIVYRADRVATVGRPLTLEIPPLGTRSRVPLAQRFRAGDGPAFVVVANHFKSKGCGEATGADADQGDGQSCWNATRLSSARQLRDWLARTVAPRGEPALVIGDLNAYRQEDPVRALVAAGYADAFADAREPPYSFVYDGAAGRLDHALLNPALASRLAGAAEWHVNADEADHPAGAPGEPGPWRSSDHDPVLLGFRLRAR